ncbi:MAG: hypothetical protein R3B72_19245 [Polyangiaceae bacterium]
MATAVASAGIAIAPVPGVTTASPPSSETAAGPSEAVGLALAVQAMVGRPSA